MRLTKIGVMGLFLGLAVYGCSDDGGSSSGGSTGGSAGESTGGSATGGAGTGGAGTGGAGTGGSAGDMGTAGMGGMGGVPSLTQEQACTGSCEVRLQVGCNEDTQQECEEACMDEADYVADYCASEFHALTVCEAGDALSGFQCGGLDGDMVLLSGSSECWDQRDAFDDCLDDNDL